MPLEGLRAWIGEVERKLGMRTRVFLVLTAIAIGGAGAAIYLALDTRDNAVSESDVRALQEDLETRIATGGAGSGADLSALEADLRSLEAEVEQLRDGRDEPGGDTGENDSGGIGTGTGAGVGTEAGAVDRSGNDSGSPPSAGATSAGGIATDDGASSKARLPELLEEARRQSEAAEEQGEGTGQTGQSDEDR